MTSPTVPPEDFTKLLMSPPVTGMPVETGQLGNMKFDDQHWKRAYNMCIGRGGTHDKCKNIPMDAHITPQNPLPMVFQQETMDAIDCMTEHGDAAKCYHFTEFFSKKVSYEEPPKGMFTKVKDFGSKAGTTLVYPALLVGAMSYIKFA